MTAVTTTVRIPAVTRAELDAYVEGLRAAHNGPGPLPTVSSVVAWLVADGLGKVQAQKAQKARRTRKGGSR